MQDEGIVTEGGVIKHFSSTLHRVFMRWRYSEDVAAVSAAARTPDNTRTGVKETDP